MSDTTHDKRVYMGTSVRAYDDGRVEGMLVPFTTAQEKDYYQTYFDKRTDYGLDAFPVVNAPALYQHGLDQTLQVKPVGRVTRLRVDDVGLWVEAQLALKDEYDKAVHALAKRGLLSWSSGALPQSVIEAEDGHIDRWYIIEASLTPTPATPNGRTQISAIRSISDLASLPSFAELTAKENDGKTVSERALEIEISEQDDNQEGVAMTRDEIKVILTELLAEMGLAPAAVDVAAVEDMMAADVEKLMVEEKLTEEARSIIIDNAARAVQEQADKRKSAIKNAAYKAARAAVQPTDGISQARAAGVRSAEQRRAANISVAEESRYAGRPTSTLRMAAMMQQKQGETPDGNLLKTIAARTDKEIATIYDTDYDAQKAIRAAIPFRADEIDATNIAGYGQEWVAVGYSGDVWRAARETLIWEQLTAKGMMTKEILPGTNSTYFPTEGSDPIAYSTPEANDVDATGRPEMVYNISPFATGRVEATAAPIRFATAYTYQLGEDSLVDIAAQVDYQMRMVAAETVEKLIINGDTTTTANTNINSIDGTPGTGLSRPYYLAQNGIRKLPLVTNTANTYDANNTLTPDTYLELIAKLPSKLTAKPEDLLYIVSNGTRLATLAMVQLLTDSERGAFATFTTGKIPTLWGIDTVTSGFMVASNTAGKVATTTPTDNTRGTILLVYPRYWGLGFKRAFTLETERFPGSETNVYYGSMRMSLVYRSTDAAAIAIDVPMRGS